MRVASSRDDDAYILVFIIICARVCVFIFAVPLSAVVSGVWVSSRFDTYMRRLVAPRRWCQLLV